MGSDWRRRVGDCGRRVGAFEQWRQRQHGDDVIVGEHQRIGAHVVCGPENLAGGKIESLHPAVDPELAARRTHDDAVAGDERGHGCRLALPDIADLRLPDLTSRLRIDRDGILRRVNVSPRIGTAVLLTESGNAVVRGGWGMFVERTPSMAGAFTSFETAVDTRFPSVSSQVVTQSVAPSLYRYRRRPQ